MKVPSNFLLFFVYSIHFNKLREGLFAHLAVVAVVHVINPVLINPSCNALQMDELIAPSTSTDINEDIGRYFFTDILLLILKANVASYLALWFTP